MIFIKKVTFKKEYIPFIQDTELEFGNVNLLVGDQGVGKSTLLHLLNTAKNKNVIASVIHEAHGDEENSYKASKFFNPDFMGDKGTIDDGGNINQKNFYGEYDDIIEIKHSDDFHLNLTFFDTETHNPRIKYSEYDSKRPLMQELSAICKEMFDKIHNEDSREVVRSIFNRYSRNANAAKEDIDGFIINSHRSHGETILPMLKKMADYKNQVILLDEPETSLSIRSQFRLVEVVKEMVKNGNQLFIATHSPILIKSQDKVLSLEHKQWMASHEFIKTQQHIA